MRLIHTTTLQLQEFFGEAVPRYAILSHRWEDDEVTFQDLVNGEAKSRAGWMKVLSCCQKSKGDGWTYLWIDSCCIDKTSSAELSEAINTMFEWYERSQMCYAYLSDVPPATNFSKSAQRTFFIQSQWFTRGWTLQELLAPRWVEFLASDWSEIGTKSSLAGLISVATRIKHLFNYRSASIAQKMSWASTRQTTRVEDGAYCLMGLFEVNMPLLYGEGMNAFLRLQLQILSQNDDETIFAWERERSDGGLLAPSPTCFQNAGNMEIGNFDSFRPPFTMTNKGLCLELYL
ncbi:heterokaryon incompatibility protein-domain-containing protein, partial [Amylocarpus encephaloides]